MLVPLQDLGHEFLHRLQRQDLGRDSYLPRRGFPLILPPPVRSSLQRSAPFRTRVCLRRGFVDSLLRLGGRQRGSRVAFRQPSPFSSAGPTTSSAHRTSPPPAIPKCNTPPPEDHDDEPGIRDGRKIPPKAIRRVDRDPQPTGRRGHPPLVLRRDVGRTQEERWIGVLRDRRNPWTRPDEPKLESPAITPGPIPTLRHSKAWPSTAPSIPVVTRARCGVIGQ
jgi:hypothetical protein